jgi:hypothetical protein
MLSVLSLAIALVAVAITTLVSVRQAALMRHANELPAFVDLLQEYRSGDFYVHQQFILHDLGNLSPRQGYSGLRPSARRHFLIMFDYLSSMACLVSFDIVTVYHVYAIYGYLFQDLWAQMRPFVLQERELKGRDIGFVVEDLCRKLAAVDHETMARKLGIQPALMREEAGRAECPAGPAADGQVETGLPHW